MTGSQKRIVTGIVILAVSFLLGIGGAAWCVHKSFDSLRFNETAGIGAIGGWLFEGIVVTVIGLAGMIVGLAFVIGGIIKRRKLP
jgi:hypothetical protein